MPPDMDSQEHRAMYADKKKKSLTKTLNKTPSFFFLFLVFQGNL